MMKNLIMIQNMMKTSIMMLLMNTMMISEVAYEESTFKKMCGNE